MPWIALMVVIDKEIRVRCLRVMPIPLFGCCQYEMRAMLVRHSAALEVHGSSLLIRQTSGIVAIAVSGASARLVLGFWLLAACLVLVGIQSAQLVSSVQIREHWLTGVSICCQLFGFSSSVRRFVRLTGISICCHSVLLPRTLGLQGIRLCCQFARYSLLYQTRKA